MKISYNWLKSYIPDLLEINLPNANKLRDIFTYHLTEIEGLEIIDKKNRPLQLRPDYNNFDPDIDYIFDMKILPDRAHDLLSHRGVARDLAGILGLEYKNIEYKVPVGEQTKLSIKVESENCRRYMGRIIKNVEVSVSPEWVKEHLSSVGQRSINNLVDATNIVMFDRGNPIHVFDLDKVSGSIVIRQAKEGEKMTTLDNKEVKLGPANMVIADKKNILALAGIKGGKIAEVDKNTKNIIIEVANFDPTSVRKTSKEVNIFTDAVKRFENDLSPEVASDAMNDMSALVLEMCKGATPEEVVDVYTKKQEERKLSFNINKISKRLGLEVSVATVEDILKHYGVSYKNNEEDFEIIVPKNRLDLNIEEDMAEEIGRILGYEIIKEKSPEINKNPKANENFEKINWARNKLLNDGYSEVMTYSFRDKGEVEVLASASDKKFLRTNLSDGLKESLKLNQLNMPLLEMNEIKIFEIGTVFKKDGEEMHIAYNEKKEIKEMKLEEFLPPSRPAGTPPPAGGEEISPRLDKEGAGGGSLKFQPWSIYPFISRDVAVWMPEGESSEKLKKILTENGTSLLIKEPYIFDSFTKDEKTSYAFRLVFQSYERTLTDTEINEIMTKITNKIKENNDWQVR